MKSSPLLAGRDFRGSNLHESDSRSGRNSEEAEGLVRPCEKTIRRYTKKQGKDGQIQNSRMLPARKSTLEQTVLSATMGRVISAAHPSSMAPKDSNEAKDETDKYWFWIKFQGVIQLEYNAGKTEGIYRRGFEGN